MTFVVVVVALLGAGAVYQALGARRDRRRCVRPGHLVDVGGHRLHVVCRGTGRPVTILESGIAASSLSWSKVQPGIAGFAQVCAYDRAGFGWSDAPRTPRTFDGIVHELHVVVEASSPGEPAVLVGHSFGCLVVRAYAARHPERTLGMVLVDPPTEWLDIDSHRARMLRGARFLSSVGAWLARFGVVRACLALLTGGAPGAPRQFVRIFGPTAARTLERLVGEVRKLPPDVHPLVQAAWCQPKCFRAMAAHLRMLQHEAATIAAFAPPREIPVTVISSRDQPPEQIDAQRALAANSASGKHVVAAQSGHWILFDEPELIVAAVRSACRACAHVGERTRSESISAARSRPPDVQ
jgi:pimeloyl-ACP methyl ester carboxylesterase